MSSNKTEQNRGGSDTDEQLKAEPSRQEKEKAAVAVQQELQRNIDEFKASIDEKLESDPNVTTGQHWTNTGYYYKGTSPTDPDAVYLDFLGLDEYGVYVDVPPQADGMSTSLQLNLQDGTEIKMQKTVYDEDHRSGSYELTVIVGEYVYTFASFGDNKAYITCDFVPKENKPIMSSRMFYIGPAVMRAGIPYVNYSYSNNASLGKEKCLSVIEQLPEIAARYIFTANDSQET